MGLEADDSLNGGQNLILPSFQSPNYVAGVSGWAVFIDGSCEFNNGVFRGTVTASEFDGTDFVINSAGLFFYSGTPAAGNLIASLARVAGTDSHGNAYLAGMTVQTSTKYINMDPSVPQILFQPENDGSHTPGGIFPFKAIAADDEPQLKISSPFAPAPFGNSSEIMLKGSGTDNAPTVIRFTADTLFMLTSGGEIDFTASGGVNVDVNNTNSASRAFVAGTIGSGSVNWYRGASNRWNTDDSVLLNGTSLFVGSTGTVLQEESAAVLGITNALVGHGETWHTPTAGSGWVVGPFSGTIQPVQYRQDAEDNIVIVGAMHTNSATPAATLFTLPVGWRPATTQRSPCVVENNSGTPVVEFVEINSSGAVSLGTALAASGKDVYFQVCVPRGVIS